MSGTVNAVSGEYVRNIRIFISSPGDMSAERDLVVKICENIELDLGRIQKFRIDAMRWETHAHSAIVDRSQAAITEQLGEYDIYVGIMGYYFGSGTGKFDSGTEEEFRDALVSHRERSKPEKIQFYFSAAQVHPDDINVKQYAKVKKFKAEVGEIGVFHRSFEDLQKLDLLIRHALINDISKLLEVKKVAEVSDELTVPLYSELKPYGHLKNLKELLSNDHESAVQMLVQSSVASMAEFATDLGVVGERVADFSKSMVDATRETKAVLKNPKKQKYLEKKIAAIFVAMEAVNNEIFTRIAPLERCISSALSAFQRAASIQRLISDDYEGDVVELIAPIRSFRNSIVFSATQTRELANSLPKIETLGARWEGNRKILIAVLLDFADFNDRLITTINELEEIMFSDLQTTESPST